MNWTVLWLPDAEQELAEAWLHASSRNAVTQAAHLIERRRQSDPDQCGQVFANGRRCLVVPPLGVIDRILPPLQQVQVIHVWLLQAFNGVAP